MDRGARSSQPASQQSARLRAPDGPQEQLHHRVQAAVAEALELSVQPSATEGQIGFNPHRAAQPPCTGQRHGAIDGALSRREDAQRSPADRRDQRKHDAPAQPAGPAQGMRKRQRAGTNHIDGKKQGEFEQPAEARRAASAAAFTGLLAIGLWPERLSQLLLHHITRCDWPRALSSRCCASCVRDRAGFRNSIAQINIGA